MRRIQHRRLGITAAGRTQTIRRLIERALAETGREPSDEELAMLLACSPKRIAHHRKLLASGRR